MGGGVPDGSDGRGRRIGHASGGAMTTITSLNPPTLEPLGSVDVATPDAVKDAIARARRAQRSWGTTPLVERAAFMRRAAEVTADRAEHLANLLTAESGKTIFESYVAEVMPVAETFKWL